MDDPLRRLLPLLPHHRLRRFIPRGVNGLKEEVIVNDEVIHPNHPSLSPV